MKYYYLATAAFLFAAALLAFCLATVHPEFEEGYIVAQACALVAFALVGLYNVERIAEEHKS